MKNFISNLSPRKAAMVVGVAFVTSVFKSGYIPKSLGILLMFASFTYIVFFVETNLPKTIMVSIMSIMAIAEFSLSIWLIVKRNGLPENNPG